MKMKLLTIICSFLCCIIFFNWGYEKGKDYKIHQIKWHPRLAWQDYLKEQGREDEKITKIYIEQGCLYVGTESGFLVPNVID